jgi:hypothetical protein
MSDDELAAYLLGRLEDVTAKGDEAPGPSI